MQSCDGRRSRQFRKPSKMSKRNVALSGLMKQTRGSDSESSDALLHVTEMPHMQPMTRLCQPRSVTVYHYAIDANSGCCTVFVRLNERRAELRAALQQLNVVAACRQQLSCAPAVGSCVLALPSSSHREDNNNDSDKVEDVAEWCRAVVLRLDATRTHVLLYLMDYGRVSRWRPWHGCLVAGREELRVSPAVEPCQLLGVDWCVADSPRRLLQQRLMDMLVRRADNDDDQVLQEGEIVARFSCSQPQRQQQKSVAQAGVSQQRSDSGGSNDPCGWCGQFPCLAAVLCRCLSVSLSVGVCDSDEKHLSRPLQVASALNSVASMKSSSVKLIVNESAHWKLRNLVEFMENDCACGVNSAHSSLASDQCSEHSPFALSQPSTVDELCRSATPGCEDVTAVATGHRGEEQKDRVAQSEPVNSVSAWLNCHETHWKSRPGSCVDRDAACAPSAAATSRQVRVAAHSSLDEAVLSRYKHLRLSWHSRPVCGSAVQLCTSRPRTDLQLVNVSGVRRFFVAVADDHFDTFQRRLHELYDRLPLHPRQLSDKCMSAAVTGGGSACRHCVFVRGSYWVARWDDGGASTRQWGRVVIERAPTTTCDGELVVPVHWVDFGESSEVSACQLRPITEQLAAVPVFITAACCADIVDNSREGDDCGAVCESFIELVDCAADESCRSLRVHTVRRLSSDQCLAVVVWRRVADQWCRVSHLLASRALPLAVLDVEDDVIVSDGRVGAAALSPCASITSTGSHTSDVHDVAADSGESVCLFPPRNGGGGGRLEQLQLPAVEQLVYARVTSCRGPQADCFHVALPLGTCDARHVARVWAGDDEQQRGRLLRQLVDATCSLEGVSAALRRHYEGSHRGAAPPDCGWKCGQLVAVRWRQGSWQRARLAATPPSVSRQARPGDLRVEAATVPVYLVDWGREVSVSLSCVRRLARRFCTQPPFQALLCRMPSCDSPDDARRHTRASANTLTRLKHSGQLVLLHVLAVDGMARCVTVELVT